MSPTVQTTEELVCRHMANQGNLKFAGKHHPVESYDAIAYLYDALAVRQDWQASIHVISSVLPIIRSFRQPIRVLDAGCGTGLATAFLRRECRRSFYPSLHVTGIDFSSHMIRESASKVIFDQLICADVTRLRLSPSFHVVVAAGLFESERFTSRNVPRILNFLKPQGVASLSITTEEFNLSPQAYLSAFRNAKCDLVSHVELPYKRNESQTFISAHYFVLRKRKLS